MAGDYTPQTWVDETGVGDGTLVTAARLNNIEGGVQHAIDRLQDLGMAVVVHGAVASVARPSTLKKVFWIGSVTPTNGLSDDVWYDTSGGAGGPVSSTRKRFALDTEETLTSTSYAYMGTPDKLNVDVPAGAIVQVGYQALWKASAGGNAGNVALFIGSDQFKAWSNGTPVAQAARSHDDPGKYTIASMSEQGMQSDTGNATDYVAPVTTGQGLGFGGMSNIVNLPAGNYDIGVKYKSSSGTIKVKNRVLFVVVMDFA